MPHQTFILLCKQYGPIPAYPWVTSVSSNFNSDTYLLILHYVYGTIPGAAITIFPFQEK